MLSRDQFIQRFGERALFGMIHLPPLPGAPLYGGGMTSVLDAARRDAAALAEGGCAGIVVENFGDRPFFRDAVPAETIAAMAVIVARVAEEAGIPVGVNVLRNDARAAMAIAAAAGAAFIRVNVHTGAMLTDQGVVEGKAAETLRLRAALGAGVLIFADHMVKHAVPLAAVDEVQAAKDVRHRGLADALIVSGVETGAAPDEGRWRRVREALPDAPLLIGSGLTAANATRFAVADGAIAGTSIKRGGQVDAPVDADRVRALVEAFRAAGGR